ncbi:MAG: hypothetical protein NVSMB62_15420 [Acidobacteriaceae bacterium]
MPAGSADRVTPRRKAWLSNGASFVIIVERIVPLRRAANTSPVMQVIKLVILRLDT